MKVHYFEEFTRIYVVGKKITKTTEIQILCKAQNGEAVNIKSQVTCEECKKLLWPKSSP